MVRECGTQNKLTGKKMACGRGGKNNTAYDRKSPTGLLWWTGRLALCIGGGGKKTRTFVQSGSAKGRAESN